MKVSSEHSCCYSGKGPDCSTRDLRMHIAIWECTYQFECNWYLPQAYNVWHGNGPSAYTGTRQVDLTGDHSLQVRQIQGSPSGAPGPSFMDTSVPPLDTGATAECLTREHRGRYCISESRPRSPDTDNFHFLFLGLFWETQKPPCCEEGQTSHVVGLLAGTLPTTPAIAPTPIS